MFLIIGELINSTRGEVKKALQKRDEGFIRELARAQYEAGAEVLDVNAGEMMEEEIEVTKWLTEIIQDEVRDVRLAIDTANPEAMEVGLENCNNRPIINSITNEEGNQQIRELAAEHQDSDIIGLAMGEEGMPETVEERVSETESLLSKCEKLDIDRERLYIDTIAMSVGSSPNQGKYVVETVNKMKEEYSLKTSLGLSNVSFGLPDRSLINSTFLAMLLSAGLDAALIDPTEKRMMETLKAAECLLAEDRMCLQYLKFKRGN